MLLWPKIALKSKRSFDVRLKYMNLKENRLKKGQAAVEYLLLIVVATMAFGYMFGVIRQNIFKLWVCDMGAQVQGPTGCGSDPNECFRKIQDPSSATASLCTAVRSR